jgi:AcrR family transcriptional regulator
MKCFAANGIEAGSLRGVTKIAGVSVGFVQNRFGSKGALVEAVNQRLVAILTEASTPSTPGLDPAAGWSQPAMVLIAKHPDAIDYLGQLLLSEHPTGRAIFDQLVAIGTAQCRQARATDRGQRRRVPVGCPQPLGSDSKNIDLAFAHRKTGAGVDR